MLNYIKPFLAVLMCISMNIGITKAGAENGLDTAAIEKITGRKGTYDKKENVFKVSLPRTDIHTIVGETKMTPPMGLTAWAAFTPVGDSTMVMGDMVLLENHVNFVMSVALDNGLDVTALHNHFLWDSPKVMFMHIGGMGDQKKLAEAVGKVFSEIERTIVTPPDVQKVKLDPSQTTLDSNKIDLVFGTKGQLSDGVYKVTFGRTTKMGGYEMGNAMGVNTWAAFVGSDDLAVVDGDFAMYEQEVQTVLKTLRGAEINIVAIHNHMIMESPRVIFLHFWGIGKTTDLAKGLKAAMDTQKNKAQEPMKAMP
jgi:hypothetical protein